MTCFRPLFTLACLVSLCLLAGCSSQPQAAAPAPGGPSAAAPGQFKVALLTTGHVNDKGWNQLAYDGLLKVEKDLGATGVYQENIPDAQFAQAFQDFAAKGCRIIFAHGDEFSAVAAKIAPQYPNTVFITTGGDKTGPNLMPINFKTEEGTYLQGMEAALVSKTGKGGFVGGQDLPPVRRAAQGFANGAKAINPDYTFQTTYINGWSDTVAARAQAQALLNNGADTLAHNCDEAAKGLFQAAASKPGVYSFGVNVDENWKAPNVLSSVYLNVPKAFSDIARQVKAGTFKARPLVLGIKEGDITLIDNPKLAGVIPAAGKAKIQNAQQAIAAGRLKVAALPHPAAVRMAAN